MGELMVDIAFRTDNAPLWTGQGSDLDAPQIDENFYNLKVAIEAAVASIGDGADDIVSISLSGTSLYFHKASGEILGPISIPVVAPNWRAEWAALTAYAQMDLFRVTGTGLYLVLQDHTSAATFDEGATQGGNPLYLKLFGFSGASGVNLADLGDVALTGLSDQQFLRYDSGTGKWVNVTLDALTGLDSLADVTLTSPSDGEVLRFNSGTGEWENQALGTMADQNAGAVAITGGTITGIGDPTNPTDVANKEYVDSVGASGLPGIGDGDVLANLSGSSASPSGHTLSDLLDYVLDNSRGAMLFRGASGWTFLPAGVAGKFLKTGGTLADPSWADPVGSGTVTEVDTGTGLTGGPITGSGTISLDAVADSRILANVTGSSAAPVATSLTALLDHIIGTARGSLIVRGSGSWAILGPGTIGQFLASGGAGSDLTWQSPAGSGTVTEVDTGAGLTGGPITATGTISLDSVSDGGILANISGSSAAPSSHTLSAIIDHVLGSTRGDILRRGASGWEALTPGASGQFLQTQGSGADAIWAAATAGGGGTPASLWLEAANYATAAALPANTYNNGTSGVGATLTGNSVGALTVDGSAVSAGQRILVKDEATASHNGVYAVTTAGSGGAAYVLTRVTDYDTTAEIIAGTAIYVLTGTANAKTSWVMTQSSSVTVGTTSITFESLTIGLPLCTSHYVLGNPNSYDAPAAPVALGHLIDLILGSTQGYIAYRGASAWVGLAPGTSGEFLKTQGASADPVWDTPATGSSLSGLSDANISGPANNDFLVYQTSDNKWHNRTHAQATAALDALVGDSGSGGTKGLAPAPGAGDAAAGKFLKADATWAVPPSASIGGASDANVSSPANKDLLWYQTSDSKWHNATLSAVLDSVLGSARGEIIYRGSSTWSALAPGTTGQLLITQGSSADPYWGQITGATGSGVLPTSYLAAATVATAAALSSNTYANGSSGVGATLTATTNGALAVDGYTVSVADRILVKDEATQSHNGVYAVTQTGDASNPYILTRVTDFDQTAEVTRGVSIYAGKVGTTTAGTSWTMTTSGSVTLGTTAIAFEEAGSSTAASISDTGNLSRAIDAAFGSTRGAILSRGATYWQILAPGSAGYYLKSNGSGADLGFVAPVITALTDIALTSIADNDFLVYHSAGSNWTNRTPAAVTALLDTMGGDAGSGGTKGLVPAPGAGDAAASKFLKADGTWATVSSGTTTLSGDTDVNFTSLADKDTLVYDSGTSKWLNQRAKYLVSAYVPGTMGDAQYLMFHRFTKAVTFPANFGSYLGHSSKAGGSTNATGSTAIGVYKAASASPTSFSSVGSITIGSGGVTPTFATSGGTTLSFSAGDVILLRAPTPADASFADFYSTLVGYES